MNCVWIITHYDTHYIMNISCTEHIRQSFTVVICKSLKEMDLPEEEPLLYFSACVRFFFTWGSLGFLPRVNQFMNHLQQCLRSDSYTVIKQHSWLIVVISGLAAFVNQEVLHCWIIVVMSDQTHMQTLHNRLSLGLSSAVFLWYQVDVLCLPAGVNEGDAGRRISGSAVACRLSIRCDWYIHHTYLFSVLDDERSIWKQPNNGLS